jgi:two-component system, sensor histidine kinase PdtaS
LSVERLLTLSQLTRTWPVWRRYGATAMLVCLALGVRLALGEYLYGYPFILFYPVVVLAAMVFDRGSGLLATALSAASVVLFLTPPRGSFELSSLPDIIALVLFVATAFFIAMVVEIAHALLHRLRAAERDLKTSLDEMSHRTRNNLQLLASMLSLESRTSGQSAETVVRSAVERIRAFGRIHNRLLAQGQTGTIDAARFLGDLCADLQAGLIGARLVTIRTELEPMAIGMSEATTLGLLVNELVTNAMKHAYGVSAEGTVVVALRGADGVRELSVVDDGIGMAEGTAPGFGMNVVRTLVSQIRGTLDIRAAPESGTRFVVRFP